MSFRTLKFRGAQKNHIISNYNCNFNNNNIYDDDDDHNNHV